MLKLMITEFKKNISIRNTTFCSIIVLVCFFCLCFVIESYQDSTIEALATNYYTSHSFEYFQIDEKNEYEIQSYIDNKPVESTLSDEEVLETFERYAQIHVEITDALYGSDIDRINELLLEEENIRILLKGKNYYIEELKKSPLYEKCKGNLICSNESVEKEALPPLEMAQYNLKHHIPYKSMDAYIMQADDYIYTIETILFVVLIPILGLFMSYLCLNQEKKNIVIN